MFLMCQEGNFMMLLTWGGDSDVKYLENILPFNPSKIGLAKKYKACDNTASHQTLLFILLFIVEYAISTFKNFL